MYFVTEMERVEIHFLYADGVESEEVFFTIHRYYIVGWCVVVLSARLNPRKNDFIFISIFSFAVDSSYLREEDEQRPPYFAHSTLWLMFHISSVLSLVLNLSWHEKCHSFHPILELVHVIFQNIFSRSSIL